MRRAMSMSAAALRYATPTTTEYQTAQNAIRQQPRDPSSVPLSWWEGLRAMTQKHAMQEATRLQEHGSQQLYFGGVGSSSVSQSSPMPNFVMNTTMTNPDSTDEMAMRNLAVENSVENDAEISTIAGEEASQDENGTSPISCIRTRVLRSNKLAHEIRMDVKRRSQRLLNTANVRPKLAVISCSQHDPASRLYARSKWQAGQGVGIDVLIHDVIAKDAPCPDDSADPMGFEPDVVTVVEPDPVAIENHIKQLIHQYGFDHRIHGVVVQLPLRAGVDVHSVLSHVPLEKDVDGLHPVHFGEYAATGVSRFVPPVAAGVMSLLDGYGINVLGKHCVIIGKSIAVGLPLLHAFTHRGATVTSCDVHTPCVAAHTRNADIVVSACGVPRLVRGDWIKPGAILVDLGINREMRADVKTGKPRDEIPYLAYATHGVVSATPSRMLTGMRTVGDIDEESVRGICASLTPVPGGCGPMTVAMMMQNVVMAAEHQVAEATPPYGL